MGSVSSCSDVRRVGRNRDRITLLAARGAHRIRMLACVGKRVGLEARERVVGVMLRVLRNMSAVLPSISAA